MSLEWMDRAACLADDVEPEIFFQPPSVNPAEAKAVCRTCPVRDACQDYAQTHAMEYGVWGGTTEDERRAMRVMARDPNQPTRRPNQPTWDPRCGKYAGVGVHRRKGEALCVACREARSAAETAMKRRKREETRA